MTLTMPLDLTSQEIENIRLLQRHTGMTVNQVIFEAVNLCAAAIEFENRGYKISILYGRTLRHAFGKETYKFKTPKEKSSWKSAVIDRDAVVRDFYDEDRKQQKERLIFTSSGELGLHKIKESFKWQDDGKAAAYAVAFVLTARDFMYANDFANIGKVFCALRSNKAGHILDSKETGYIVESPFNRTLGNSLRNVWRKLRHGTPAAQELPLPKNSQVTAIRI